MKDAAAVWTSQLTDDALPRRVVHQLKRCILDGFGAALGGTMTRAGRISAEFAAGFAKEGAAPVLATGGRLSVPGAVLANVTAANALDIDDGYRLSKGHPGGFVIMPLLAVCAERGVDRLLTAAAAGYEVATRAAVATHGYYSHYHASGSWGALGSAACIGHVLGLDVEAMSNALGLAEYHAALSPIERCLGNPAMTKDAIGWGAFAGTCAAYLAAGGFTGNPSLFADPANANLAADFGSNWRVLDLYFKPYPCCRWTQPGVDAIVALRKMRWFEPQEIESIAFSTFREATLLQQSPPRNSEEAQYHLFWGPAAMLVHGGLGPDQVSDEAVSDPRVIALLFRMNAVVDPEIQKRFPAEALCRVKIDLKNGERLISGLVAARGDAHIPLSDDELEHKFRRLAAPALGNCTDEAIQAIWRIEDIEARKALLALAASVRPSRA